MRPTLFLTGVIALVAVAYLTASPARTFHAVTESVPDRAASVHKGTTRTSP